MSCRIDLIWNEECKKWTATSQDLPGLVLESGSFDSIIERVRSTVPEQLGQDAAEAEPVDFSFYLSQYGKAAGEN